MAHDEYQLQTLLELRQQEKDAAEEAYAHSLVELENAKKLLASHIQSLQTAVSSRQKICADFDTRILHEQVPMAELRSFQDYVRGLQQDERDLQSLIDETRQHVHEKQRASNAALELLRESNTQLEAVQQHHQSWLEERAIEQQRKEDARMDEVASRLWREKSS